MFKSSVAKQASNAAPKNQTLNHFKTAPSTQTSQAPLGPSTGNIQRYQQRTSIPTVASVALDQVAKRNASGLTRVLSQTQSGFDEPLYPIIPGSKVTNTYSNNVQHSTSGNGVVHGADFDFDVAELNSDDWEMEVEQIMAMPTRDSVLYPDISADLPRLPVVKRSTAKSEVISFPLPWSSSPISHFTKDPKTALDEFKYRAEAVFKTPQPPPKSATKPKKRRLPQAWEEKDEDLESKRKSTKPFPWDVTQSAIKQQQKLQRDTKKRVKVTETEDGKADAIAKRKRGSVAKVFLSDEQQIILNMVVEQQKSIFFTGSAGTGKSVLLREIIASLRRKYYKEPDRISITASTGLAACNIGGVTLHSFSGIGIGNTSVPELIKKIKRNQKAKHRWMRTKVLIIDEVSMVDGDLFDKLEAIARELRKNGRPFGGIQLIITGDFFQLPPVPERGTQARFAFNANSWNTVIEQTIALHKVFRQKDPEFAGMLNQMREGRLDAISIAKFRSLSRDLKFDDDLEATELFSTRAEVERANQIRLQNLNGETRIYESRDGGSITDKAFRDKLLSNVMAPERITLKKGAQVMLIKNYDETLVNGSLGKVIGFMSETQFDNYQEQEDFQATQGGTLLDDIPIAASKTKSKVTVDLEGTGASQRFPVVRFAIADGTTRDFLCKRETWSVEQPNGEVQASRSQIPLILAWALSIHKAQGQTLERVKVNLSRAFEKGQAYVALSRATSMAGLQVLGFDPSKVVAHETVRRFYASLSRLESNQQQGVISKAGSASNAVGVKGANALDNDRYDDLSKLQENGWSYKV